MGVKYTKLVLKSEQEYVDFLVDAYKGDLDDVERLCGIEFSYGGKFCSDLSKDIDYDAASDDRYQLEPDKTYKKLKGYNFPKKYPCLIQIENYIYWDGTDLGFEKFTGFFYESDFHEF